MIKAMILDADGLLAETQEAHRRAFNETFELFRLDWYWTRETYRKLLRIAGDKERMRSYQKAHPNGLRTLQDQEIRQIHKAKVQRYGDLLADGLLSLRAGMKDLVDLAMRKGVRLAVATSNTRIILDRLCQSGWGRPADDLFEVIAADEEVGHKKPASDKYDLALQRLGLSPQECLAFEGSHRGVSSAKAAGLPVFAMPNWYTREDDLSAADWVAEQLMPEHILQIMQHPAV